jgi:hypothetical protein
MLAGNTQRKQTAGKKIITETKRNNGLKVIIAWSQPSLGTLSHLVAALTDTVPILIGKNKTKDMKRSVRDKQS